MQSSIFFSHSFLLHGDAYKQILINFLSNVQPNSISFFFQNLMDWFLVTWSMATTSTKYMKISNIREISLRQTDKQLKTYPPAAGDLLNYTYYINLTR